MSAGPRELIRVGVTVLVAAICAAAATLAGAATATGPATAMASATAGPATVPTLAIVIRDQTALRAAPHETAQQQALLWQGEVVEVRGERVDHLQVWDYRRERGGFVEASRVRRTSLAAGDAPELLAVLRFVRDAPGAEALGIGFAAAYLKAATPDVVQGAGGAEAFDAIGTMADRLAQRASSGSSPVAATGAATIAVAPSRAETALAAHLEVAARYGVAFKSFERDGAMRICYDGEAFRRVLAMATADATERARAALGLTRPECLDPALPMTERQRVDAWRGEVLDRVDTTSLSNTWRSRVAMRRASVWSGLAFQRTRRGESAGAEAAAKRAIAELADVDRRELADGDLAAWNDAAIRVGASRWAAATIVAKTNRNVGVITVAGEPGQTCVLLVDVARPAASESLAKRDASVPLAKRCTYGVVWAQSATLNREGNVLALAVQPMEGWRELWVFARRSKDAWSVQVLPPSTVTPELGYAEFAGWVPGGRQMLVVKEARGAKGLKHNFEVVRTDTLSTDRQASDPSVLGPFMRWQDPAWKRETVSLR